MPVPLACSNWGPRSRTVIAAGNRSAATREWPRRHPASITSGRSGPSSSVRLSSVHWNHRMASSPRPAARLSPARIRRGWQPPSHNRSPAIRRRVATQARWPGRVRWGDGALLLARVTPLSRPRALEGSRPAGRAPEQDRSRGRERLRRTCGCACSCLGAASFKGHPTTEPLPTGSSVRHTRAAPEPGGRRPRRARRLPSRPNTSRGGPSTGPDGRA